MQMVPFRVVVRQASLGPDKFAPVPKLLPKPFGLLIISDVL